MSRIATSVALITLAAVSGCGGADRGPRDETDPQVCTQIGCRSGVTVIIPRGRLPDDVARVEVCVRGRCRTIRASSRGRAFVPISDIRRGRTVRLQVRLVTRAGRTTASRVRRVRLVRVQPNGPGCPPVCFVARVRLPGVSA